MESDINIQIQVLSTTTEDKQSAKGTNYRLIEVAYKDLTGGGKVSAKKIMPFGESKPVFDVFALAKPTEVYDVEMIKGEKYWDWVKATKGVANATAPSSPKLASGGTSSSVTTRSTYETPEERAIKQVYIVRQSSLNVAQQILSVGAKAAPKSGDVIALAKEFEAYVFGTGEDAKTVAAKDVGTIETMSEDIPF